MKRFIATFAFSFCLSATALYAGSATWKAGPGSTDWNSATNWAPRTVPHRPTDTATFANSDITDVTLSANADINGIVFTSVASTFQITTNYASLSFAGTGIVNNSDTVQFFLTNQLYVPITFYHHATAGTNTSFEAENIGQIAFYDRTTAGAAYFGISGNPTFEDGVSAVGFYDNSSAENGSFENDGGSGIDGEGGGTTFLDNSTAASGSFANTPATAANAEGGGLGFVGHATAANSFIVNYGATVSAAGPGYTLFAEQATAGNATTHAKRHRRRVLTAA